MPLFIVERRYAEQLDVPESIKLVDEAHKDGGVHWVFSFLSADKRQSYCLYEAPSAEAVLAVSKRLHVPADTIVEVGAAAPELRARLSEWAVAQPGG